MSENKSKWIEPATLLTNDLEKLEVMLGYCDKCKAVTIHEELEDNSFMCRECEMIWEAEDDPNLPGN